MVQWSRAMAALPVELGQILDTYTRQVTAVCNLSLKGSDTYPFLAFKAPGTHTKKFT